MKILITTGEWKSALTCMRSLAKAGHVISLICPNSLVPALHSKFCKERIISPDEKHRDAYLGFIFHLIKEKKYDLLIPISDLCVEYFSEKRDEIAPYLSMLLPSREALDIARDKSKTYRFAYEHNIPIPKTFFVNNMADVQKVADEVHYPCFAKEAKPTGGSGNTFFHNKEPLNDFFRRKEQSNEIFPVIQEFVEGRFFGLTAVCNKGRIIDFFIFEAHRLTRESGGTTVYARSCFKDEILKVSERVIERLSWTGAIDFDFIVNEKGGAFLLEINPRFSGTIQFAYNCGVDLPLIYSELLFGEKDFSYLKRGKYKTHMFYRSIFPEEVTSIVRNKKYIIPFFANFLKPRMTYDFSLVDPNLFFWQLKQAKWTLFS